MSAAREPASPERTGGAVAIQWAAVALVVLGQFVLQGPLFRAAMCRNVVMGDYLIVFAVVPFTLAMVGWAVSVRLDAHTASRFAFRFGWLLPLFMMLPVFFVSAMFDEPFSWHPENAPAPTACEAAQTRAYAINLVQLAPLLGLILVHVISWIPRPRLVRIAGIALVAVAIWVPFVLLTDPFGWDRLPFAYR